MIGAANVMSDFKIGPSSSACARASCDPLAAPVRAMLASLFKPNVWGRGSLKSRVRDALAERPQCFRLWAQEGGGQGVKRRGVGSSILDRFDATTLEIRKTVPHGRKLLRRVPGPSLDLAND